MKVTVSSREPRFKPVYISITLESQAEMNALGSLFNTAHILSGLQGISGDRKPWHSIALRLQEEGADTHRVEEFS